MKIEGRNAVEELLKTAKTIDKILVQNGMRDQPSKSLLDRIRGFNVKVQFADKVILDKESETHRHQGFIAYVSDYKYVDISELTSGDGEKLIVVLDGIEDPHNLGSIIRVAECCGATGIIIGKHRSATVNETVMRISEGSANHIKIAKVVNINNAIDYLKNSGIWVYALEVGGQNIFKSNLTGNLAIVVGGEDTGVNKLTLEKCDAVVTLPLYGKVNSLNASVATGACLYECIRQRKNV